MAIDNFFKNTYVIGEGRRNYLRANKYLEDPLFTGFTFDIDYISSPLFYTLDDNEYDYPKISGKKIEEKLSQMYKDFIGGVADIGYDILPVMSAEFLNNGDKLGFGLQKNVYMDRPLYGATEYIYMVDKRNAGFDQSDVRYSEVGDNANLNNSYKLGDTSVYAIVSESDAEYAKQQIEANEKIIEESLNKMNTPKVQAEHDKNKAALDAAWADILDEKIHVDGYGALTESEIKKKIRDYDDKVSKFNSFKQEIVDWVNSQILSVQNDANSVYKANEVMVEIMTFNDDLSSSTKEDYAKKLKGQFGPSFRDRLYDTEGAFEPEMRKLYNSLITNGSISDSAKWWGSRENDGKSLLLNHTKGDQQFTVRESLVVERFKQQLKDFNLYYSDDEHYGDIKVGLYNENPPKWLDIYWLYFTGHQLTYINYDINRDWGIAAKTGSTYDMIKELMYLKCNVDSAFSEKFNERGYGENSEELYKLQQALTNIQATLYGYGQDADGNEYGPSNPDPYSLYGIYSAAKEKYENDAYSQAAKAKGRAESGSAILNQQLSGGNKGETAEDKENYVPVNFPQTSNAVNTVDMVAPQTVLDMLGFIKGMKKMTMKCPYLFQGITGLDTAYNNHYGIKDPYMGSGDDKITLTCLESLDLRVSSMFNRYFNAVYDRQYRRERVPVNLRRFNCSVYVHDIRNFVSNRGGGVDNRILELRNMYYGVIEFKFYDCEIVPEETGNIFNDISNEAPTEMKKTNFTFKYGNCVVNFVPNNLIERYENE